MTESLQQPIDLDKAIAKHLLSLRKGTHVTREAVARKARYWGLGWSASTVAAIEDSRRRLSIGEFLMLPTVLSEAGIFHMEEDGVPRRLTLSDVLPPDEEPAQIAIAPQLRAYSKTLRDLFDHRGDINVNIEGGPLINQVEYPGNPVLSFDNEDDEVTKRMAKALKSLEVSIPDLAAAAQKLWGRSLRGERDARFDAELQCTGEARPSLRRKQALLGHVMRGLAKEIRAELAPSHDQPTRRRRVSKKGGKRQKT